MKTSNYIRQTIQAVVVGLAAFIGTSSCVTSEKRTTPPLSNTFKRSDAQFLERAVQLNLAQVQLGQLAQTKSSMTELKELGGQLEKDHTLVLGELRKLADQKGIELLSAVTSEAEEEYKELTNKSDKKFNDDYCELVIKGHRHAIAIFETASIESEDLDVRKWASAKLSLLCSHLDQTKMLKAKCENM